MVILRYVTCIVAAIAVISFTIHLERNTGIVYSMKSLLGLDTSTLEQTILAQQGQETEAESGFLAYFAALAKGERSVPKLEDIIPVASADQLRAAQYLPGDVDGWQREERPVSVQDIAAFHKQVGMTDAIAKNLGPHWAGVYYFKGDQRVLVFSVNAGAEFSFEISTDNYVDIQGRPFRRLRTATAGSVYLQTLTDTNHLVAIAGNIGVETAKSFLLGSDMYNKNRRGGKDDT